MTSITHLIKITIHFTFFTPFKGTTKLPNGFGICLSTGADPRILEDEGSGIFKLTRKKTCVCVFKVQSSMLFVDGQ